MMPRGKWSHQHSSLLHLARREQQVMDLGRNTWRQWQAAYEAARATMNVAEAIAIADVAIKDTAKETKE